MKQLSFFLLSILFTLSLRAQLFKKDELVEVDPLLSDSLQGSWKKAEFMMLDSANRIYHVKLVDGNQLIIPSRNPEKWIRPVVNKQVLNKYGPGARFPYQKRSIAMKGTRCNPSEIGVKKNITSLMAAYFKDFPYIFVEHTSFKGQHGYEDKEVKGRFVYPYKIEMLVHLRRTFIFGGVEYTQYQTWEFDRVYEYATKPGKKCEFYALPSNDAKLLSSAWY